MTKHNIRIFGKKGTWINLLVGSKNKQAQALIYLWFLMTKGNIHQPSEFSRRRAHVSFCLWVLKTKRRMSHSKFKNKEAHVLFYLWFSRQKGHM